ncbi:hypothetical protein Tcan_08690 [Toxocara canis]|uniref:Uncharacterized protein n=1 Tax=Toxocara canis TaxID=6265 RepID=A0A0B2VP55_TOXCA|nr:hypothetical protein Tcan_08690 [Toxocara canis]
MEILIQPESRGIHYEGYESEYIQCVFEDGDVSGKNERYEFRSDRLYQESSLPLDLSNAEYDR